MAPSTRDRILAASLELFNTWGEPHVSTAFIASHLSISEGNLWYHFRTKRELVLALFNQMEERSERNLSRHPTDGGEDQLAVFSDYLRQGFRDIWDFRFLYRDRLSAVSNDADLNRRIQALLERNHGLVERLLTEMVRRNLLQVTPRQIARLATNAQLVCRYWMDYVQSREGLETLTEQHINAGLEQVFSLFQPYLLPPRPPGLE